jgi:hypothetical protein
MENGDSNLVGRRYLVDRHEILRTIFEFTDGRQHK